MAGASPPATAAVMTFDGHDGYVLWYGLVGGASSVGSGETWTYSSGVWINRTLTAGIGPSGG
ncbi:MAG: hypothetical protein L3K17_09125 [Thermoplasmata archaeon]|nr:hypothetical protein [Thermoplasmata archaeon]